MAIQSFGDKSTEQFFNSGTISQGVGWSSLKNVARRKLDMIHYAFKVSDLSSPPGNKLEALKGNLSGYYSIRINDQWRVVFKWSPLGATNVRITDYH